MNRDGTRCGAAGLRRSAIVERLRLREEWSALKEVPNEMDTREKNSTQIKRTQKNNNAHKPHKNTKVDNSIARSEKSKEVSEVLRGVVVLVDVGSESRALALRAALTALGASVVPSWSPLVTHLVWTQGGCRSTRAKARAFACQVLSPLWVEACAAEGRKLPERIFPAPTRPSDLPSPATLRRFLKRAERENLPLQDLLSNSQDSDKRPARLRLSSDTENDTSAVDTSRDTADVSKDTSHDATDIESRVNTAPRRKTPVSADTVKPAKSKRKLFTQKEPELQTTDEESDNETAADPKKKEPSKMTQRGRKDLAQAERMARLLIGAAKSTQTNKHTLGTQYNKPPRFILTGMSRKERHEAWQTIKQLNGKVQQYVDRKTTHVIMGSCLEPEKDHLTTISPKSTRPSPKSGKSVFPLSMCNKCNSPGKILSKMFSTHVTVEDCTKKNKNDKGVVCNCDYNDISGVKIISDISSGDNDLVFPVELRSNDKDNRINLNSDDNNQNHEIRRTNTQGSDMLGPETGNVQINDILTSDIEIIENDEAVRPETDVSQNNNLYPTREQGNNHSKNMVKSKPRTVNALLGAARGCRVLRFEWLIDSLKANRWLHHIGYEVRHLKKISQKARVERSALKKMRTEYAYNVFNGMRVKISPDADQKDAITQLLTICGAVIQDGDQQNIEKSTNNDQRAPHNQKCRKNARNGAKITFSHLNDRIHKQNGGRNDQLTQRGNQLGAQSQVQDVGAISTDFDLTVGQGKGEVSSKWVFDSVAAARMRTTRRYINN